MPIDYESYSTERSRFRRMSVEQRREGNRQLTAMAFTIIAISLSAALLQAVFG